MNHEGLLVAVALFFVLCIGERMGKAGSWKYRTGGFGEALGTHPELSLHILQILKSETHIQDP